MVQENNSYIIEKKNNKPLEVVSIPVSLYKSLQGKYFVGQTDTLYVGNGSYAWAGLINPHNSDINLYTNVFTISNFSDENLIAEIWLNTNHPSNWLISNKVSPTNTSLNPLPENKAKIRFVSSTNELPQDGINVYQRIVPPNATLVGEEDGKFIEGPSGNYVIIIKSSIKKISKVVCAFGWWEKSRCH